MNWKSLYGDYPSHGTNTFWLDTGNYYPEPIIPHPSKLPTRFYRIVKEGTNTAANPIVSINFPTNGFVASGDLIVSVGASSADPVLSIKLYVDGEEIPSDETGTNFLVNTCEWPNGNHVLFATAKSLSDHGGSRNTPVINVGRSVSEYVSVTFDNLISRLSFSEPFFDPAVGQTQKVSAVFGATCNWTLEIQDDGSNTVKTASGSGISMQYLWDGTDSTNVMVPAGIYSYLLSAETNGFEEMSFSSEEQLVQSQNYVENEFGTWMEMPLPPLPPGLSWELDEQGNEVTSTWLLLSGFGSSTLLQSQNNNFLFSSSSAASQNTRGPKRPPTKPAVRVGGLFGIAYQEYIGGITIAHPLNGLPGFPSPQRVQMEGTSGSLNFPFIPMYKEEAAYFVDQMKNAGWKPSFVLKNDELEPNHLASSTNVFNQVELGVLMLHGAYGTSPDYLANAAQQIYLPIHNTANTSGSYVRMSNVDFGSSGTNGLKWMAIMACNSLRDENYHSMENLGVLPINNNLHLLLGLDSTGYSDEFLLGYWARAMTGLSYVGGKTIKQAWYDSARLA